MSEWSHSPTGSSGWKTTSLTEPAWPGSLYRILRDVVSQIYTNLKTKKKKMKIAKVPTKTIQNRDPWSKVIIVLVLFLLWCFFGFVNVSENYFYAYYNIFYSSLNLPLSSCSLHTDVRSEEHRASKCADIFNLDLMFVLFSPVSWACSYLTAISRPGAPQQILKDVTSWRLKCNIMARSTNYNHN